MHFDLNLLFLANDVCEPQDPSIKQMAEQIANDPSFKEIAKQMQESFGAMMGAGAMGAPGAGGEARAAGGERSEYRIYSFMVDPGTVKHSATVCKPRPDATTFPPPSPSPAGAGAGAGAPAMPGMPPGMALPPNFDPSKYMEAMTNMFQNPNFMQMAEKLGKTIIEVGAVARGGSQARRASRRARYAGSHEACVPLACSVVFVAS